MEIITNIIDTLSKEEIRAYKLFAKRTNNNETRKDIELFDSLKKNPSISHQERAKSIYNETSIDAKYYRLKNKLSDDIGLVLMMLNHKKTPTDVLYNISLSTIFYEKKKHKLSFHYLTVAEKKALENEDYSLLDIIYELMIRYNTETVEINPDALIHKRIENTQRLVLTQDLENNFAKLNYQLKVTQNFVIDTELLRWIEKTIKTTRNLPYVKNSKSLRIKTFQNLIRLLALIKDYDALKNYLKETLKEFEHDNLFNKLNHNIKLELLIYLGNTTCILKNYKESITYTDTLYEELQKYNKQFYDKYLFYYYNILVNIYSQLDVKKAIEILEKSSKESIIKTNNDHYFFVLINLSILNFNTNNYKIAAKNISKLYIHTNVKKLDPIIKIKILVFDMIVRIELKEISQCKKLLIQANQYTVLLDKPKEIDEELSIIAIIESYLKSDKPSWSNANLKINQFLRKNANSTSVGYIKYSIWLTEKIKA